MRYAFYLFLSISIFYPKLNETHLSHIHKSHYIRQTVRNLRKTFDFLMGNPCSSERKEVRKHELKFMSTITESEGVTNIGQKLDQIWGLAEGETMTD